MAKYNQVNQAVMHLSLLLGVLLTIIPWPNMAALLVPHWCALLIAYWSLNTTLSGRVMYVAFAYGLILDVLMGSLLGKHGMSLVALSFLVTKSAKKLRITSFWQLLMMVLVWLFNDIIIRAAIDWISFRYIPQPTDLLPLLTAALIWPWLKYILDRYQTAIRTA